MREIQENMGNRRVFVGRELTKKFEEGIASQVEYLDAQTTLTNAAINEVITRYDYYITYAEYERIVAAYNLNTSQE